MHIRKELARETEQQLVAMLSSCYTLLALVPYDSWSHEGTPAQMAAYVVKDLKDQGRLGFLQDILLPYRQMDLS